MSLDPEMSSLSRRKYLGALVYALFLCTAIIGGLELLARFGLPESDFYRTRSLIESRTARPRVLLLGDSFTIEGEGLYSSRIGTLIDQGGGVVINASRSGMGPEHYLRQAHLYTPGFSPDLILLNYFVGNDITDTIYYSQTETKQKIKTYLSAFFLGHVLIERVERLQTRLRIIGVKLAVDEEKISTVANPLLLEAAKNNPYLIQDNLLINTPRAQTAWARNRKILEDIFTLARKHDAALQIVIIPANLQTSDRDLNPMREIGFTIDSSLLGKRVPQDLLLDFCQEQQLDCLDLLPAFLNSNDPDVYIPKDFHWNASGNRLAFDSLKPSLVRILFPGESGR